MTILSNHLHSNLQEGGSKAKKRVHHRLWQVMKQSNKTYTNAYHLGMFENILSRNAAPFSSLVLRPVVSMHLM